MERESNQLEAGPILCRTGCGFFGSSNTDGLCSKCYKDALKKKQQPPGSSVGGASSPPSSCGSASSTPATIPPSSSFAPSSSSFTAQPTVPPITTQNSSTSTADENESASEAQSASENSSANDPENSSSPESEGAKKKKNKCATCKKKVGLTGFTCRCGGLYCSVHRYSNEHRCTFDYRELGAEEIRRNNPVVKGEKIQKI